ncbi:MAG: diguanylate cyclase [Coriobacteriia bacterium]|nr:diguanylate cyclase [Coriobacteriia bacterium]
MRDASSADGFGVLTALPETGGSTTDSEVLRPHARLFRAAAWILYPCLAVLYVATLFSAPAGMGRFGILEAIYLLPIVGSVAFGWAAYRQSEGAERHYWVLISVANAVLGLCEVVLLWWLAFVSPLGPPPVTWQFGLLHVVAAVCFLTLIFSMTRLSEEVLTRRVRAALDMIALGLIVYTAILTLYARPVMSASQPSVVDVLVGSAYPLAAFMMLFGTLGNIVGFKMVKWRSWETLTAVAIGIYSMALVMWPLWYTTVANNSRNMERGLLDLIQFSGHFLLMTAAVYRLTETDSWNLRPLPVPAVARERWFGALLPAASVTTIVVLGVIALQQRNEPEWFAVYGIIALVLTIVVMGRSLLLALENGRLFVQSVTDPLTGLYNHRYFHDRIAVELDRAKRYSEPVALVVFNLDDFAEFNERCGHLEGDRLLADLGHKLQSLVVGNAIVARLGGDEFGILLPEYDARSAAIFTQHVLDVIGVECGDLPGQLSASAGVAAYPEHGDDGELLLHLADGALLQAKETGKGRVIVFDAARVPDLSAHERIERLERHSRVAAVRALAAAVDARDIDTRFHTQRVAKLAVRLADHLELPGDSVRMIELLAVVHDVGKIAIPDTVLKKAGSLTAEEWGDVRRHPEQGQRILASTGLTELVPAVRSHHECWDGSGYPDGLVGVEIPFEARLLCVCDAYEAMSSDRSYRSAMSLDAAAAEIARCAGTQFDPELAKRFLEMLRAEEAQPHPAPSESLAQRPQDVGGWVPLGGVGPERG